MRVLSFNIHKGFSAGNRFALRAMRTVIEEAGADLVLLQEVVGAHRRHAERVADWPAEAQFEFLADRLWPHHAYGRNAVYDEGHHGNAILSRHPLLACDNIDVTVNRFAHRGLLHAVIGWPGLSEPLHAICLHLDLFETSRARQAERLGQRIAAEVPPNAPLIVAGDFSDWRERVGDVLEGELGLTEAHKALHGRCARSFPSWAPLLRLDRIYCRGLVPRRAKVLWHRPWTALSDHGALVAEFAVPDHAPDQV